jgi:fluoride exporter
MRVALFVAVGVGGFIGAPCRYFLDRVVSNRFTSGLPWGTFTINITGSFILGFLTGLSLHHHLPELAKALLASGFCGAYTTFSTFTFETFRLLEDGQLIEAGGNVVVSVLVGLAGAAAGVGLGLAF